MSTEPTENGVENNDCQPVPKRRLFIAGWGYFAQELAMWMHVRTHLEYQFIGFLWDETDERNSPSPASPNLENYRSVQNFHPGPNDVVMMGFPEPERKRHFEYLLRTRGTQFVTALHPSAVVGEKAYIGDGAVVGPNVVLGRGVLVDEYAYIGPGCMLEYGATVSPFSTLGARVVMAVDAWVDQSVSVGAGAVIAAGVRVGQRSAVSSGCVVSGNVPAEGKLASAPEVITELNPSGEVTNV